MIRRVQNCRLPARPHLGWVALPEPRLARKTAPDLKPYLTSQLASQAYQLFVRTCSPRRITLKTAAGVMAAAFFSTHFLFAPGWLIEVCVILTALAAAQLARLVRRMIKPRDAAWLLQQLREFSTFHRADSRQVFKMMFHLNRVHDALQATERYIAIRKSGGLAIFLNGKLRAILGIGAPDLSYYGLLTILSAVDGTVESAQTQLRRIESGLINLLTEVIEKGHFDRTKFEALDEMVERRLPPPKRPF